MKPYNLLFHHIGAERGVTRIIEADAPDHLAQAVHLHARGILGSRNVTVDLDPATLTGTITSNGTLTGRFTLTADRPAPAPSGDPMHGYTLADITHLVRLTLRLDRWHTGGDIQERYDAVHFAIVETLLTAEHPPTRGELLRAGTEASDALVKDEMRTQGRCTQNLGKPMPRFHAYWNPANPPSPEGRVVDRLALDQIWPQLQPRQQQALTALAATGDYEKAAAALGVTRGTFSVLVSTGRRRFYTWWHEHEIPSKQWRTDRRVCARSGKDWLGRQRLNAAQVDAYRQRRNDGELLRELAAEAGLSKTALSRLLSGKSKPAQAVAA